MVLETVQGYRLELLREPVQTVHPRMLQTSPHEQNLLQEEILSMLQKGEITQLTPRDATTGFYSSLFKRGGGHEASDKSKMPQRMQCFNDVNHRGYVKVL